MTAPSPQPLPPPPIGYQTVATASDKDAEHLRLLSLFHYIGGGLVALFSSFGLLHVFVGSMMVADPTFLTKQGANTGTPPPPFMGWMMLCMGLAVVLSGWTVGGLTILSGRRMSQRRGHLFSLVMAGVMCLWMPIGTILGVFTFIVLLRPSVKAMYGHNSVQATA